MSQIKTLNGVQYTIPQYNDTGWGANTGNVLTQYLAAIADVTLQLSGGAFTLTADANFGATYGLVSTYFKSRTAGIASAGQIRLANTDTIKFRNGLGSADLSLAISANRLTFEGSRLIIAGAAEIVNADVSASAAIAYSKLTLTGSIVNADVNAAAAIAYSKLTLTGSIVNADVNAAAAIAYSKLTLTGSIVNADVNAAAAIAYTKLNLSASIVNADIAAAAGIAMNKLAALTASRALVTDGSGFHAVATTTAAEIGYVNGVTSAIQTQLDAKAADSLVVHLAGTETVTGAKTFQDQKLKLQETGSTDVVTINVAALAASRDYTIRDAGASATVMLTTDTTNFVITPWATYTPTLSAGFGTTSNVSYFWRQVGDTVQVKGSHKCGTVAGSVCSISVPSGKSINFAKMPNPTTSTTFMGPSSAIRATNVFHTVFGDGSDTANVYIGNTGSVGSGMTKTVGTGLYDNNDYVMVDFTYAV